MSASSDRSAASSVPASRNHRDVIASSLFRRQRVPHPPVASPRRAAVAARFRRGRRRINNRAPARLRSFAHAPIQSTRVSMCRTDASRLFRKRRLRRFDAKRRLGPFGIFYSHCLPIYASSRSTACVAPGVRPMRWHLCERLRRTSKSYIHYAARSPNRNITAKTYPRRPFFARILASANARA